MTSGTFAAGPETTAVPQLGIPFDAIQEVVTLTGDAAITVLSGVVLLTKGSAAAITIAVPEQDGQTIWVIAGSAQAHVITQATVGFNAKGSSGTATFGGALGDSVCLISAGGNWYAVCKTNVTIA